MSAWLERMLPSINFVWRGSFPPPLGVEPRRYIYDHELVMFRDGACTLEICGTRYECQDGSFIIVPPGVPHATFVGHKATHRTCIHFDWLPCHAQTGLHYTFLPGVLQRRWVRRAPLGVPRHIMRGASAGPHVFDMADEVFERANASRAATRATARSKFYEVLVALLFEEQGSETTRPPTLSKTDVAYRVKDLLDRALNRDIPMRDLLEQADVRYEAACKAFSTHFGVSPVRYLNCVRVEKARALLASGEYSVAEVAAEVGCSTPGYFSRLFRTFTGVSPSAVQTRGGKR